MELKATPAEAAGPTPPLPSSGSQEAQLPCHMTDWRQKGATREAGKVRAVSAGLTQVVNPPNGTPAFRRSGVAWSQDCSAQTPAGAHYLVPENTGDLETGSLSSCSAIIQLCDLEQVISHLSLSVLKRVGPRRFFWSCSSRFPSFVSDRQQSPRSL